MTVVNFHTGELVDITEAEVRASVRRVIDHAESIWDEWAWQVENKTWTILGYGSWDEMRRGEYGALTSVAAPRAERPELVARFRGAGLTQKETASTLGISQQTVSNHDTPRQQHPARSTNSGTSVAPDDDIVDAELVDDDDQGEADATPAPEPEPAPRPATGIDGKTYARPAPKPAPRKPLPDAFRDRLYDLARQAESLHRLTEDDRWAQNAEKLAAIKNRNELLRIHDLVQQVINSLPENEVTS